MLIFMHKSLLDLVQSESDTLLLESSFVSWKQLEKMSLEPCHLWTQAAKQTTSTRTWLRSSTDFSEYRTKFSKKPAHLISLLICFSTTLMDAFVEEEKSSNETTDVVTLTLGHYKSNFSKICLPIFKNQNSKGVMTFFLSKWLFLRSLTVWLPLKSWH